MAEIDSPAQTDRDLTSIAQARALARRAKEAWLQLAELGQEQIDAIVGAMSSAVTAQVEPLAQLAVEETGYGVVADKVQKNLFSAQKVYQFIRPMKTVGVVARHDDTRVVEIAEPFGVVAAVVPSTNPTSTAIYKILISLKARCAIVVSPHPAAVRCITRVAEIMDEAARRAGAPAGAINWMTAVTIEGTQELMKHRDVAVILATGGMGLVRAAYTAGKPAYGVGPGNAPAYIEQTADVQKAVRDIVTGKTFDNGVLCSAENSVVVDEAIAEDVRREFVTQGGHFLSKADIDSVARSLVTPQRLPNPAVVGRPATFIAEQSGVAVPAGTRVLIAPLEGVGRDYPLSIEKLCPVLAFYVVKDWREGCERCKQILRYGGMGHTMAIHSRNEGVILEFGLKKPAFRIVVNTPTAHGSIGLTTGLDPALTLGCGGYGGNITSDNISPRHLLNIKRLAYELSPVANRFETAVAAAGTSGGQRPEAPRLPEPVEGVTREALERRIDTFLGSRGYHAEASSQVTPSRPAADTGTDTGLATAQSPLDFVCEEDVRRALRAGKTLTVSEHAIITPSARDLGEEHGIFKVAPWRG